MRVYNSQIERLVKANKDNFNDYINFKLTEDEEIMLYDLFQVINANNDFLEEKVYYGSLVPNSYVIFKSVNNFWDVFRISENFELEEMHAFASCKLAILNILNNINLKKNSGITNNILANSFIKKIKEDNENIEEVNIDNLFTSYSKNDITLSVNNQKILVRSLVKDKNDF